MITIHVPGISVPQGSMRSFGKGRMVYRDDLKPWRNRVRAEYVRQAGSRTIEGAVSMRVLFVLPRPDGHYGTGRNAGAIKPSFRDVPHVVPADVDKLARSCGDALTLDKGDLAGLPRPFRNDSQITHLDARKRYVRDGETPHAEITLSPAYESH